MAKWIEDLQGRLEVEKVTEELKLPVWKANYKGKFREFWNECWEKIEDSFLKIKKSNEGKEPAITTKETAFNKPFGVSEDTVLEGNKFTQMTGKDYGGILNITGQKEAGKAYWDNNTKKLYICKNNNSDISPNVNNYIPFDSNSLLERLENLYKVTKTDLNISNSTFAYVIKQGNICFLFIDSKQAFYGKKTNEILFTLPQNLIPSEDIAFSFNSISSNSSAAAKIYKNGQCKLLSSQTLNDAFYISVSYACDNFN